MSRFAVAILLISLLGAEASAQDRTEKVMAVDSLTVTPSADQPRRLIVEATGTVNSSGWTQGRLVPRLCTSEPADGFLTLEFVATAPEGMVLQVLQRISASAEVILRPGMKGVRVTGATNAVEAGLPQSPVGEKGSRD